LPEFIKTGWELKVASNQNAMTDEIRAVGQRLETLGSLAWKLLGAGGGGFVLALYEKGSAQRVVSELTLEGKQVIVLGLDLDGSKTFEV
jgi:galactokinase/mevalonate kinase-like predicted kinase